MIHTKDFLNKKSKNRRVAMCGLRSGSIDIIKSSVENKLEKKDRQKREPIRTVHNSNFEPSMKLLSRILKVLIDSNSIVKTTISKKANMNYRRLTRYLDWLQKKHLIESIID